MDKKKQENSTNGGNKTSDKDHDGKSLVQATPTADKNKYNITCF
jgi:hypothetical protein